MAQQKEAVTLGMWVFLVTEIMFFGGMFTAYLIYRMWYYRGSWRPATSWTCCWAASTRWC